MEVDAFSVFVCTKVDDFFCEMQLFDMDIYFSTSFAKAILVMKIKMCYDIFNKVNFLRIDFFKKWIICCKKNNFNMILNSLVPTVKTVGWDMNIIVVFIFKFIILDPKVVCYRYRSYRTFDSPRF